MPEEFQHGGKEEQAAEILKKHGIYFESKNGGDLLVIPASEQTINYGPGTELWIARNGKKGFGMSSLLKYIEELADRGPEEPRLKLKPQPEIEEEQIEEEEGPRPR